MILIIVKEMIKDIKQKYLWLKTCHWIINRA